MTQGKIKLLSTGMGPALGLVVWLLPLRAALADATACSFAETAGKAVLIPSAYALKHCNHKVWATVFERTVEAAKQPLEKTMEFRKIRRGRFMFPSSPQGPKRLLSHTNLYSNDTASKALNEHFFTPFPDMFTRFSKCGMKIFQPVVLYRAWAPRYFQYGHVMSDLLPFVVWIYNNFASNDTKIVVEQDTDGRIKSFMEWFDGKMHERMIYVPADTIVCAESWLAVVNPAPRVRRPESLRIADLHRNLRAQISLRTKSQSLDKVVAYERVPGDTRTGRLIAKAQFSRLLDLTAEALRSVQRPADDIVVFNGRVAGTTQSLGFEEQYRLFSSAYLALGPHGSGLSNILWMQNADCHDRPAVIEFMCSTDARSVRGCYVVEGLKKLTRIQSWWRIFAGAPWVRYFMVWMLHHEDHESEVASVDEAGFNISLYAALKGEGPQMRRLQNLLV